MKEEFDKEERLQEALRQFGSAVREWGSGEHALSQTRTVTDRRSRLRTFWALAAAAMILAGAVTAPVYERHRALEAARRDAQLMEQIDVDLARQEPAPLEPLTRLVALGDANVSAKESK